MFSLLKSKKPEAKTVATFAVESGSVTLTVIRISGKEAKIIFINRKSVNIEKQDAPKDALRKTIAKIEEIFAELLHQKFFHVIAKSKTLMLLGSSWSIAWRESVSIKKDKPFRLTKAFIKESIDQKFKSGHADLQIISSHLMSVSMNGYKIKDPIGKTTPALELDVFVEAAPIEALQAFSTLIEKYLPHSGISFSTTMFASAEAISEHMGEQNFILLLPEASSTEIAIVRDGAIHAGASLPFGSRTISRELFADLTDTEARHKLMQFIEKRLDAVLANKISGSIDAAKQKFLVDFHGALFSMSDSVLCPSVLFVGGKSPAAFFISDWIKKDDYAGQTLTANCFRLSALSGHDLLDKESFSGKDLPFVSSISLTAAKSFIIQA
ncbi:MAG: hypothetical protein V4438_03805 [Patescibacteria group bacterium]